MPDFSDGLIYILLILTGGRLGKLREAIFQGAR